MKHVGYILVYCLAWRILALEGHQSRQGRRKSTRDDASTQHHDPQTDGLQTLSQELNENFFQLSMPGKHNTDYSPGPPPKMDIVFALDASQASTLEGFDFQKQLVEKLIDGFSVSLSGTRVVVVSCSLNYNHLNFDFKTFANKKCLYQALPVLRNPHRARAMGQCLQIINWRVLKTSLGMRRHSKKVVFVITTGKSRVSTNAHIPTKKLKRKGVEIFGLGIGPRESDFNQLKNVVSFPAKKHMFWLRRLNDTSALCKLLSGKGSFSSRCHGDTVRYDECDRRCVCINSTLGKCTRVRKDFQSMSEVEKGRFVRVLKKAATEKPYQRQFERLASVYESNFARGIHDHKFFLPWHRAFLLKLENLLSQIDCRVTVPYWDWSLTSGNPWKTEKSSDLWSSAECGLGGNGTGKDHCVRSGPFKNWQIPSKHMHARNCLRRIFHGKLPSEEAVLFALGTPLKKFSDFELILRAFFFDSVACQIGGDMCSETAAYTPEFALFTGFVDKLWAEWQNKGAYHRDAGFPHVYLPLPGFRDYTGEVQTLDRQPGCVRVLYQDPSRGNSRAEINRMLKVLQKGHLFHRNRPFSKYTRQGMETFLVTEEERQRAHTLGAFL